LWWPRRVCYFYVSCSKNVLSNNLRYIEVCIRICDCLNSLLTESYPPFPTPPLPIASVFNKKPRPTMVYLRPHQKYCTRISRQRRELHSLKKPVIWKTAVDDTKILRGIYC
jgi:hypothetical protein